jgi:hypothetical protein
LKGAIAPTNPNLFIAKFITIGGKIMTTQRPTGVTILAVLQFIGGALSLLFGISSLFFGGLMVVSGASEAAGVEIDLGPILLIAGVLALISGLIGLIAGYGLFTLKPIFLTNPV